MSNTNFTLNKRVLPFAEMLLLSFLRCHLQNRQDKSNSEKRNGEVHEYLHVSDTVPFLFTSPVNYWPTVQLCLQTYLSLTRTHAHTRHASERTKKPRMKENKQQLTPVRGLFISFLACFELVPCPQANFQHDRRGTDAETDTYRPKWAAYTRPTASSTRSETTESYPRKPLFLLKRN